MRCLVQDQALIHQVLGCFYAQTQEKNLITIHSGSSLLIYRIHWHKFQGEFQSGRRGALQATLKQLTNLESLPPFEGLDCPQEKKHS